MRVSATVARGELRDGELEPATNRGEGRMLVDTSRASQGLVQVEHRPAHFHLAVRQLQQRPLVLSWEPQMVQVTPARPGGVGA